MILQKKTGVSRYILLQKFMELKSFNAVVVVFFLPVI